MSEEINKDYLIDWIDRPPSNTDLKVINYITSLQQKVEQLEKEKQEIRGYIEYSLNNPMADERLILKIILEKLNKGNDKE